MRRWAGRSSLLGLAILAGGCTPAPDPEIRIGILASVTGAQRETSGRSTAEGALLAEQSLTQSGGLIVGNQRYRVRLLIRDVGDQADRATSEARHLINEDDVIALVGPQFSRDAIPVASLAEQARVPMISPMSSHPRTTLGKRYVFRVAYVDDVQGCAMARFARESLGALRAAVLYDVAGDYNRNLAEVFAREFERHGGTIVANEQFTSDEANDFKPQLLRIRAAKPDVIFSPNFIGPASIQMLQARRLGLEATFLGTDLWDPTIVGKIPEGARVYATSQWTPEIGTEEADSFVAGYRRAYGRVPYGTAAATYDALQLLFRAITTAGSTDPDSIRKALAAVEGYHGVTGLLSYRNGGDPSKSVIVLRITSTAQVFERRMDPQ